MNKRIAGIVLALSVLVGSVATANPTLSWSPSNAQLDVGEQITLSVMLNDAVNVRTLDLTVEYDPQIVTSLAGEPGGLFAGFFTFHDFVQDEPGTWRGYCVVLGAGDWAVGPGELFRWTVVGAAEGVCPLQTVELVLLPPGGGDYPGVVMLTGVIRVGEVSAAPPLQPVLPSLALYPNPFNPRTRVELTLPGGGAGRLEILDLRGRLVAAPWHGVAGGDPVQVEWDGTDLAGHALPSGVYRFRLLGDGGQAAWCSGVLIR
jgi:hypothetical protein